jgi:adenylate kinase family enzyme
MIFGRPGSGKSTFALRLHKKTGIPLHHLDRHFYTANWVERDYQEFLSIQQNIVNQDTWIIDGNCTRSFEMRYQRADLCIYFNYPRWKCYWRIFKRRIKKNAQLCDRAEGCSESIDLKRLWKFLRYTWNFERRVANSVQELRAKYPHVTFIEVQTNRDLKKGTLFQELPFKLNSKQ